MVKCKNCLHFNEKYETVGICKWEPFIEEIPISWRNHMPGVVFVTSEREHDCKTYVRKLA